MKNLMILLTLFTAGTWGEDGSVKSKFSVAKAGKDEGKQAEELESKQIFLKETELNYTREVNYESNVENRTKENTQIEKGHLEINETLNATRVGPTTEDKLEDQRSGVIEIKDNKTPYINYTDGFMKSVNGLSDELRNYLQNTSLRELKDAARNFVTLTVPESGFFSNLIGLGTSGLGPLSYLLFIGWPFILALLYVALIIWYPNRRSDNFFEKNLSTMVENVSYMMRAAEDNFLDFMEDITDPGDSYASGSHFRPVYAFPDPDNGQEVYYKPTAYYDEYGENFDSNYDYYYDRDPYFDAWGNPIEDSSSFVNPHRHFQNPVSSFNPASSEPLREQFSGGDLSSLGNHFDLQNEIAQKDKHNFLNVILGTQYQHTRPSSNLEDQGIVKGSVSEDISNHPEPPPRGYNPSLVSSSSSFSSFPSASPSFSSFPPASPSSSASSSSFSNSQFEADLDPRLKNHTQNPSGFRPSKLQDPNVKDQDEWIARPPPLRRNGTPSRTSEGNRGSNFRFPAERESRLKHRRGNIMT